MSQYALTLKHVSIALQDKPIVHEVSLALKAGEIGCLLGPSGCGKTTLLRTVAGFSAPSHGEIACDGLPVANPRHQQAPNKRDIGMVFQDLALFPHLSVLDNVGFGIRHLPKTTREGRCLELLDLVDLSAHAHKYPHQLSGGQQQRIALVRALARQPKLLLLDEPFSSQDAERRGNLAYDVRQLLNAQHTSALLVTHDQHEAFAIADQIGVMREGRLLQWDSAYNLYHLPSSRFIADFIGDGTFLPAKVVSDNTLNTPFGLVQGQPSQVFGVGQSVELLVRPDDFLHDDQSPYTGEVIHRVFRGSTHLYTVRLPNGAKILCSAPSHHNHRVGEEIGLQLAMDHLVMFEQGEST